MVTYPVHKGGSDFITRPLPGREANVEDRVVSVNHVYFTRSFDIHEVSTGREGGREGGQVSIHGRPQPIWKDQDRVRGWAYRGGGGGGAICFCLIER